MMGLRDLENATSFDKELSTAVRLDDLINNAQNIVFGDRQDNHIPIKYGGNGLRVNIPAKVRMLLNLSQQQRPTWIVLLETDEKFITTLRNVIYARLKDSPGKYITNIFFDIHTLCLSI